MYQLKFTIGNLYPPLCRLFNDYLFLLKLQVLISENSKGFHSSVLQTGSLLRLGNNHHILYPHSRKRPTGDSKISPQSNERASRRATPTTHDILHFFKI